MANTLDMSLITSKINKSLELLRSTYRSLNGKGGWYHYLDSIEPGPTASAVGLMSFKLAKAPFEHANEVLSFLKSKQVVSSDPLRNGGWAISMMPDQPSIEASGWVIKSLGETRPNMSPNTPDVHAAYNWLLKNKNDDHGWGSFYGQSSRTYLTCLALRSLAAIDPFSEVLLLGQNWLFANKNKNLPAWGATLNSPPTILHTGFVLITLSELNLGFDSKIIESSLEWLTENIDPKKSVESESLVEDYDIYYQKNGSRETYQNSLPHYALPIAISALLRHKNALDNDLIYQGLLAIANLQHENGYWENARNPTRISMWAVWPFLQTLIDAVNLPILSSAKTITKISDAILIRTDKPKVPLLFLLLSDFALIFIDYIKAYWSPFLLLIFVAAGLYMTSAGIIRLSEFIFSLIFPIVLIFVQLSLERRKSKTQKISFIKYE